MKTKALIAVTLLTVHSIAAAESAAEGPVLLSAEDMDGITAAGFSSYVSTVSAAAEAIGRYTMTTTRTDTLVRGNLIQAVQYGSPYDYVVASGGLAAAYTTGEGESSTSIATDDDTANFTGGITGSSIDVTRSILGLTLQRQATVRFEGVTAYNHIFAWNGL
jgi:hypothetical protein